MNCFSAYFCLIVIKFGNMKKMVFWGLMMAFLPLASFSQSKQSVNITDNSGQKQGYWIEKTGEVEIDGNYINNLKEGCWLTHLVENSMLIRLENYKAGKKNGIFLELSKRGSIISEQFFTDDIPDGPFRMYGQNGMLASVSNYTAGKMHGLQIAYYENLQNKKSEEATYKSGIKHGPSRWFNTEGNMIVEYNYVDGLLQGEQKSYFAGNKIKTSDFYIDNIQEGVSLEYYENGNVKISGQYKSGLMEGKWLEYDETGKILKTTAYSKGEKK